MPDAIVEAVAFHHEPSLTTADQEVSPLLAVHAADAIVRGAADAPAEPSDAVVPALDRAYVEALGLADRIDVWRALAHDAGDAADAA